MQGKKVPLWYVALPYTHKEPSVVADRIDAFCALDSLLNLHQIQTISPILKQLLLDRNTKLPSSWDFWKTLSYTLLERSDALLVYQLDGWEHSVGVLEEIKFAQSLNLPIVRIEKNYCIERVIKRVLAATQPQYSDHA